MSHCPLGPFRSAAVTVWKKNESFFLAAEEAPLVETFLSGVCTRPSFGSWGWGGEAKRDLTPVAPGIRMPHGLPAAGRSGASLLGTHAVGGDHVPPAPATSTPSPNQDVSKLVNVLRCALPRMAPRPFMEHTRTQQVVRTLVFLRFLGGCARFPKWGRETTC